MPAFTLDIQRRPNSAELCPPRRTSNISGNNIADAHRNLRILLGDDRQGVKPDYYVYHNGQELTSPFAPHISRDYDEAKGGPLHAKKKMTARTYLKALAEVQTTLLNPEFVARLAKDHEGETNGLRVEKIAKAMKGGKVFKDIVLGQYRVRGKKTHCYCVLAGLKRLEAAASIGFPLRASIVRMPKPKC